MPWGDPWGQMIYGAGVSQPPPKPPPPDPRRADRLIWYPPSGREPLEMNLEPLGPIAVLSSKGLRGGPSRQVATTRGYAQVGETPTGVAIPGKTINLSLGVVGSGRLQYEQLYDRIVEAFYDESEVGRPPTPGVLRAIQYQRPTLDIPAVSVGDLEAAEEFFLEMAEFPVDLLCPDPLWREPELRSVELAPAGGEGFTFPLTFPTTFGKRATSRREVNNDGRVATPTTVEFVGPVEDPWVLNERTGARLDVIGVLAAGERLWLETAYGRKTLTHVASDGTESNAVTWLRRSTSTWAWWLAPGRQTLSAGSGGTPDSDARVRIYFAPRRPRL